jgi:hypothetical protein
MERPVALPPPRVRSLLKELRFALEDLYGANLVGIRLFAPTRGDKPRRTPMSTS